MCSFSKESFPELAIKRVRYNVIQNVIVRKMCERVTHCPLFRLPFYLCLVPTMSASVLPLSTFDSHTLCQNCKIIVKFGGHRQDVSGRRFKSDCSSCLLLAWRWQCNFSLARAPPSIPSSFPSPLSPPLSLSPSFPLSLSFRHHFSQPLNSPFLMINLWYSS